MVSYSGLGQAAQFASSTHHDPMVGKSLTACLVAVLAPLTASGA